MNKLATYGVHLSEYSFATVSIPPALAAATEQFAFPISNPMTDIAVPPMYNCK